MGSSCGCDCNDKLPVDTSTQPVPLPRVRTRTQSNKSISLSPSLASSSHSSTHSPIYGLEIPNPELIESSKSDTPPKRPKAVSFALDITNVHHPSDTTMSDHSDDENKSESGSDCLPNMNNINTNDINESVPPETPPTPPTTTSSPKTPFTNMNQNTLHALSTSVLESSISIGVTNMNEPPASPRVLAMDTKRLSRLATGMLDEIRLELQTSISELGFIQGWLQKKKSAPPYSWQRRYVVVKAGYLLWSDRQMTIENAIDEQEKKRWNKCIKFDTISGVEATKSANERKFRVSIHGSDRVYLFKTASKHDRDGWIKVIKEHVALGNQASVYAGRKRK